MNYEEVMGGAGKAGTARRNKRRKVYRTATWSIGGAIILAALIWLPTGPLQTYVQSSGQHAANAASTVRGVVCPEGRADKPRTCRGVGTVWTEKFKADNEVAKGMLLCRTAGVEYQQTEEGGTTFWRFRAIGGNPVDVSYQFFPGSSCPDKF
ncbi:MAG TPA: hypothetical protein PLW99_00375 [Candidatus Paceibacterota bacterium]|nr:MAG: hypothetical protein B7X03_02770 [Parcubacteria group bacterium 21-58-10]HQT82596.1 hypothetical protein [Candidatus Paceibacterota bacterium]